MGRGKENFSPLNYFCRIKKHWVLYVKNPVQKEVKNVFTFYTSFFECSEHLFSMNYCLLDGNFRTIFKKKIEFFYFINAAPLFYYPSM